MQCIGFTLGGEYFGVAMHMVQEIIRPVPVIPLPNTPAFIDGVINLRTSIIPVVNIQKKFELGQTADRTGRSRFLVLDIRGTAACVAVDSVTGIHETDESALIAPDPTTGPEANRYLQGTCTVEDRQMNILDLSRILDAEERGQLETLEPAAQG